MKIKTKEKFPEIILVIDNSKTFHDFFELLFNANNPNFDELLDSLNKLSRELAKKGILHAEDIK